MAFKYNSGTIDDIYMHRLHFKQQRCVVFSAHSKLINMWNVRFVILISRLHHQLSHSPHYSNETDTTLQCSTLQSNAVHVVEVSTTFSLTLTSVTVRDSPAPTSPCFDLTDTRTCVRRHTTLLSLQPRKCALFVVVDS